MKDFEKIRLICEKTTEISAKVIDGFLLNYAAQHNHLEREMEQRFEAYKHITEKLQKEWTNRLKAQYIIHKVFKKEGLIKNYLNQAGLKKLPAKERKWLEHQAEEAWRFSFSVIKSCPAADFYIMEDVFSERNFLLYSPGVSKIIEDQSVILWFNLISFNGKCWQSFGPIAPYKSFEPDDIFFFATEMKPDIENEEDLLADLEQNPVPYMMLLSGANYPMVYNKKDQLVQLEAEYELDAMDTKSLTKNFKTEYNKGVYRLSLNKWGEHPHYSEAYYDENFKIILLTSMTDRGFMALVEGFNAYGYDFSSEPSIRVHIPMITTASDILKRKIRLNVYENLFSKDTSPSVNEEVNKLNMFLGLALPDINAGREPDIKTLAKKAGLDLQTAKDLMKSIKEKLNAMGEDEE